MKRALVFGALLFCQISLAEQPRRNVILVTLDGVIAADFYNEKLLEKFWATYGDKTLNWGGGRNSLGTAKVSNPHNISLPAYFSIFAGSETDCASNDCSRINIETFPEKLARRNGLQKTDIVAVTSWDRIPLALESGEGSILINSGFQGAPKETLAACPDYRASLEETEKKQAENKPRWEQNRFDLYTWAFANVLFDCHKPRFFYVSLNDTDDYAHLGERENYESVLKVYDDWFVRFFEKLASEEQYKEGTLVLISTDHGRGEGELWRRHNASLPTASDIYLSAFAVGDQIDLEAFKAKYQGAVNHSHIRSMVEEVLIDKRE